MGRGVFFNSNVAHAFFLVLLLTCLSFYSITLSAATCTTVGLSVDFSSPVAWSCGRVPATYWPGPDDIEINNNLQKNGSLTFSNNQKLTIDQNAYFTVMGDLTLTNGATLKLTSGTLLVTGNLTITNGAHVNLMGGTLNVQGKLSGSGSGGYITVLSGVSVNIGGIVQMTASNSLFLNNGTVTSTGLEIDGSNTQLVNNGIFIVNGNAEVETLSENNGTLTISGDLTIKGTGNAYSSGTLSVGRDLLVQGSAALYLTGGDATIGRDFINQGNVEVTIDGTLSVGRSISNTGSSYVCGEGIMSWEENITTSGSSSFCNGVVPYSSPWNLGTSSPAVTLPVKLAFFKVKPSDRGNELLWTSVSEENFSHYDLEKSKNTANFTKLASLYGKGGPAITASYNFIDEVAMGVCYYRLRSVDLDGTEEFSAIVQVQNVYQMRPQIYPTSISGNYFKIKNLPESATVEMVSANGVQVQLSVNGDSERSYYFSNTRPGVYIIIITCASNSWKKRVLIVS